MAPAGLGQNEERASLFHRLANSNATIRLQAALALYDCGLKLVQSVLEQWCRDPELGGLLQKRDRTTSQCMPLEITVGVALRPENFEMVRAANGSPRLAKVPPEQDAREFTLRIGNKANLDILTTREPGGKGAIARFLEKFGEGIQQIECLTKDVEYATQLIRTHFGLEPIYSAARAGADGTRVNFFLVPLENGRKALVELVEEK